MFELDTILATGTLTAMDSRSVTSKFYDAMAKIACNSISPQLTVDSSFIIGNTICQYRYTPEKVIFNEPATIVYWNDGTKTVVKCKKGDKFDKWTGYAMAYMKKVYGDEFHAHFKKWCK